jgi:hypothetical protein
MGTARMRQTGLTDTPRWRIADLTSGVGAVVLGIGIGSLFANAFNPVSAWIVLAGIGSHGWGMFDKHRLETGATAVSPWWTAALYWICWIALGVLAVALAVLRLRL